MRHYLSRVGGRSAIRCVMTTRERRPSNAHHRPSRCDKPQTIRRVAGGSMAATMTRRCDNGFMSIHPTIRPRRTAHCSIRDTSVQASSSGFPLHHPQSSPAAWSSERIPTALAHAPGKVAPIPHHDEPRGGLHTAAWGVAEAQMSRAWRAVRSGTARSKSVRYTRYDGGRAGVGAGTRTWHRRQRGYERTQ
jgi:hypothetical protein